MSDTRILVPLDGSTLAARVLPYAELLAAVHGSVVELMSVVEREPRGLTTRSKREAGAIERQTCEARQRTLADLAAAVRARELRVTTTVVIGDPVDEILKAAERAETWAVAMATHGRGGIGRWLIGSVADKIMRLNSKPTLLVRPPAMSGPERRVALHRVMVCLDGSPLAEEVLSLAVELASGTGATLSLIQVVTWLIESWGAEDMDESLVAAKQELTDAAERYLANVRATLPANLPVETIIAYGAPADTIADVAFHERIDLVVMTTHGWGGVRRLVLGSTADRVVRAGVPTLLVRPGTRRNGGTDEAGRSATGSTGRGGQTEPEANG
jgi:nucleotide-binding universal stress UspA family protein